MHTYTLSLSLEGWTRDFAGKTYSQIALFELQAPILPLLAPCLTVSSERGRLPMALQPQMLKPTHRLSSEPRKAWKQTFFGASQGESQPGFRVGIYRDPRLPLKGTIGFRGLGNPSLNP